MRRESRNEFGMKSFVQVKLDGVLLSRTFRNKGEAIRYLEQSEDLTKQDMDRRVRFIMNK